MWKRSGPEVRRFWSLGLAQGYKLEQSTQPEIGFLICEAGDNCCLSSRAFMKVKLNNAREYALPMGNPPRTLLPCLRWRSPAMRLYRAEQRNERGGSIL